jgi:TRAP-type C4-dicarboxylate transport system permease small subunit
MASIGQTGPVPTLQAGKLARLLDIIDRALSVVGALAIVVAGLVLCHSIVSRYGFGLSTDWQDEMAVFLLVGATFLSAGHVQALRGHIAISVISGVLPPAVDRVRLIFVDLVCLSFCAFFTNESWKFFREAYEDGRVSDSVWAPPLWVPYSLMTTGMALLTLRLFAQAAGGIIRVLRGHA